MLRLFRDPSREWEKLGAQEPYFGVLTHDKFRRDQLTARELDEFFASGAQHIEHVASMVETKLGVPFAPARALDFGCGVGRLVVPLAKRAGHVVGVDVSASMLDEARRNCRQAEVENVGFLQVDGKTLELTENFDFVHSFIVFQHIPVAQGERLFECLLRALAPGGVGAVHVTFSNQHRRRRVLAAVTRNVPFAHATVNLLRGRGLFFPEMQMNSYDLNRLFILLHKYRVRASFCELTDHGGFLGAMIYFQRG